MISASHDQPNFSTLLWRAAEAWPTRVAIRDDADEVTFAQLRDRAAAMADALQAMGVRPGDPICILARRGAETAAAFFGAAASGALTCLVNELYRPRQVRYVLGHTGARVLVASDEFWSQLADDPPAGVVRLDPAVVPRSGSAVPVMRSGMDPAQLIYTSGSTGQPKGVAASHANLWAGAEIVPRYLGLDASDRIASLLPFSFVYGFSQLTCALITGATLVIERSTLPQDIIEGLRKAGVTVLAGVPPLWMQLISGGLERSPLAELRVATCAGGRLAPDLVRRLRACQPGTRLFLMYGLTEVFRSTSLPAEEVDAHPDSMGRAVPGSEVLVLREDGSPCDEGEVGELVHRGPTVTLGYWRDPEGTARVFRPNPLRLPGAPEAERVVYSGDLVRRDGEGRLYYVGRRDLMIKTLGYRVSPEEISDALLASGLVREAAVSSEPDERRGERIVAHVCLVPTATVIALKQFCGMELPRYMQPARFEVYQSLPRNPSGKIDLLALVRSTAKA
jgi:amino acid adenylation domain-containing protein